MVRKPSYKVARLFNVMSPTELPFRTALASHQQKATSIFILDRIRDLNSPRAQTIVKQIMFNTNTPCITFINRVGSTILTNALQIRTMDAVKTAPNSMWFLNALFSQLRSRCPMTCNRFIIGI